VNWKFYFGKALAVAFKVEAGLPGDDTGLGYTREDKAKAAESCRFHVEKDIDDV
jgi:hypothetical protein